MLEKLRRKRAGPSIPPQNPLRGALFSNAQLEEVSGVSVEACSPGPRKGGASSSKQGGESPPGCLNQIWSRLLLQLVLPMVVALAVIIGITSFQMFGKTDEWVAPVRAAMIQE